MSKSAADPNSHSPLPWTAKWEYDQDGERVIAVRCATGELVADVNPEEPEPWKGVALVGCGGDPARNAELIVRGANTYGEMLAALEALVEYDYLPECNPQYSPFDELGECPAGHDYECGGCQIRRQILAAIQKARGQS